MGEKIDTLAVGKFHNQEIEIELNLPSGKGKSREVHIQTANGRFELVEKEFIQYASSILVAAIHLKVLKDEID
jgi:hypothetical protein